MLHNQLNTFDTCLRWKTSSTAFCPLCKNTVESWDHLPRCKHHEMRRVSNLEITRIGKAMGKVKTEPRLKSHLVSCIRAFSENRPLPKPPESDRILIEAHDHQTTL